MESLNILNIRDGQQDIQFNGAETEYSVAIDRENVVVHCSPAKHTHGSNKMKLINRVDYMWEFQYYQGQIIAAHLNGKVIAYGMKGKEGGMVRITNIITERRSLIRNRMKEVKDIAFSYSRQQIIFGYVDEEGSVWIYEIHDQPKEITYTLLLHIFHRASAQNSTVSNYRIIWCPYISCFDEDELESSDDPQKMFVIINENKAEIWNYGIINSKYGNGPIEPSKDYKDGYIEISHYSDLVDASFSSDGTAIALASVDGYVKFFQVYMADKEEQKCLHEWIPHDGKPLSSIIFVDNLLEYSSQCWKFTITGANFNSELKLWSCETWSCLQTFKFTSKTDSIAKNIFLKIRIDNSGKFLVLSDINNKTLYILGLQRDDQAQKIYVTMLSQFFLPTSFLSFHIITADKRKLRSSELINSDDYCNESNNGHDEYFENNDNDCEDYDDDDNESNNVNGIVMKMFVIHQKKLQECNIVLRPDCILSGNNLTDANSPTNKNELKSTINDEKIPKLDDLQSSVTLLIQQQSQLNYITQSNDLFNNSTSDKPSSTSRPSSVRNCLTNENKPSEKIINENTDNKIIDFQCPEKDNFASGGSSPSREVQEILSLNNSIYSNTEDYFDNLYNTDGENIPQKEYNKHNENIIYNDDSSAITTTANSEMIWPKIPIVKQDDVIKNENLRQELGLNSNDDNSNINKTQFQLLNYRISTLESLLQEQTIVLKKLQQNIESSALSSSPSSFRNNDNLKDELTKELDLAMSKQQLQIAKMLENLINMQKSNETEKQELLMANISQIVTKTVMDKTQSIISNEIKSAVMPTIRNLIEKLKINLDEQKTQKFNNELYLQEKMATFINSKAMAETLSNSVAVIISPILEKNYREMVSANLIPSLEKVCNSMFHQINDTFTQGTKEYTSSVETYMEKQRRTQEKGKDLIIQMQAISENLQLSTEKITAIISSEIHKQFSNTFKIMQDVFIHNIKDTVSEQVKLAFKNHASLLETSVINSVRSRAVTPSPLSDTQVTIARLDLLLSRENLEEAIQLALSAENLNYVIYVCEKIESTIGVLFLFQEKTLPQPCILALIQQLGMDLRNNTEIKISFIRAALVALIPEYPQTKQFIPKILKDLLSHLQTFMTVNPTSKYLYDAKLLKMAIQSMLDK